MDKDTIGSIITRSTIALIVLGFVAVFLLLVVKG